jgi:hypothetical protein
MASLRCTGNLQRWDVAMSEPVRSEPVQSEPVHPVDEILPLPKLFALGLQHVLVMYANAVAVPLIIGGALHLPKDQMAMLINADLFACGIATLIQTVGFGPFGIRLPIIMGVTAVSISPMLAMAAMPGVGLTGIYGAVLVGGIFGLCVAPFVKYVLRFFPAVVTGTIITMIGVVLMRVGVNWAGGGAGKADFGAAGYLAVAALVLAIILLVIKFTRGFLQNVAVYLTRVAAENCRDARAVATAARCCELPRRPKRCSMSCAPDNHFETASIYGVYFIFKSMEQGGHAMEVAPSRHLSTSTRPWSSFGLSGLKKRMPSK